jgi:hypothetical protein
LETLSEKVRATSLLESDKHGICATQEDDRSLHVEEIGRFEEVSSYIYSFFDLGSRIYYPYLLRWKKITADSCYILGSQTWVYPSFLRVKISFGMPRACLVPAKAPLN